MGDALKEKRMEEYMEVYFSSFGDAAVNYQWRNFFAAGTSNTTKAFGIAGTMIGTEIGLSTATAGIAFLATGAISWNDLSDVQKASFITPLVSNFTFMLKSVVINGMKASAAFELYGSKLGAAKVFFTGRGLKYIDEAEQFYSKSLAKWLVKEGAAKYSKGSYELLESGSELQDTRLTKALGRNVDEFMATRFAAALAIVNIVLSAMALASDRTTMEEAQDGLFLGSSVMELVSAAAGWAAGAIVAETTAATVLSTIAGLASALGIVAALAGVIIMLVIWFTRKKPQTPLEKFVTREAKSSGYYMEHETDIDYFEVISDSSGNSRLLGVTMKYDSENNKSLLVHSDGGFGYGIVTHGYDSVFSTESDENGYTRFYTLIYSPDAKTSKVVALTLNNGNVTMSEQTEDKDKQLWIAECRGKVSKDDDGHLEGAAFYLKNVASHKSGTNDYLTIENDRVTVSSGAVPWLLSMTGMKPQWLSINNISLTTNDRWKAFYMHLVQPGSDDRKQCAVNPPLPSWLNLDTDHLQIKQTGEAPPLFAKTRYTVRVINAFGSARANFTIEVIQGATLGLL